VGRRIIARPTITRELAAAACASIARYNFPLYRERQVAGGDGFDTAEPVGLFSPDRKRIERHFAGTVAAAAIVSHFAGIAACEISTGDLFEFETEDFRIGVVSLNVRCLVRGLGFGH
jgi:hypothetical protein